MAYKYSVGKRTFGDIVGEDDDNLNTKIDFEDDYIRTALGGFLNNSDNPNCELIDDDDYKKLMAIKHIEAGTELTVKQW